MREVDDETKKTERVPSSSEQGRRDHFSTSELASKREVDGAPTKVIQTMKKGNSSTSGAAAAGDLSSPTEANEHNSSSSHQSPRNPLDDGKGMVSRSSHRTLPGSCLGATFPCFFIFPFPWIKLNSSAQMSMYHLLVRFDS